MGATIAGYSLGLQPGELALLSGDVAALPLLREVYRAALSLGAQPYVRLLSPDFDELLLREGSEAQLGYVSELSTIEIERIRARLVVRASENTVALSGIPPERLAIRQRANQPLFARLLERKATGELKTCITQFPTNAAAQDAGMSLGDYEDFVFRACFCDRDDPAAAWRELAAGQQRHVERLERVKQVRIEGPGTDLALSVTGRKWVNSDGRANFPSGEVFTGPVEDSANGRISFDVPTTWQGRLVEGVSLEFAGGRVVKAGATRGEELLARALDTDAGSRLLGEFAFGTNYGIDRPTRNILFDEKIGGTIHLALGAGYPDTGSTNKSGIHWDMIKWMNAGRVVADGSVIYENGRFVA
jgi:aminopeptidase